MTTPSVAGPNGQQDSTSGLAGRYGEEVIGSLRCFDRVIVHGTLVDVAHPAALVVAMKAAGFRPCDLTRFAEPIKRQVRDDVVRLAREHGAKVEFVSRKNFRQEDRVAEILKTRGSQPGLVHVFAVKETANVFDTRRTRADGYAKVIVRRGACVHYYLYWIHPQLGLIHVRVPTWLPLRLQVYFNGHSWLARQLDQAGIGYRMTDNALSECADWAQAQRLADSLDPRGLHAQLDALVRQCCPATERFKSGYHWCLTQVEYSHDLVFKDAAIMDQLFEALARQALLVIKAEDVARFLGKRVLHHFETPLNSHFGRRHAGLRLKHSLGPASVKLYNKSGGILRLEMTTYDVSFFRHYRQVVHRDGKREQALAAMKKSIYSLRDLAELMQAGVQRYELWLVNLVEHTAAQLDIARLGRPEHDAQGRSYRGFNPFSESDAQALQTVLRGEYALGGLTARRLRGVLADWSRGQVGRLLKRLRLHGLLRKIGRTYTYYITPLGQRVITAVLHLKEQVFLPHLQSIARPTT